MKQQRESGLPCPNCGTFILASIDQLVAGQPLACAGCNTVLRMDKANSQGALEALQALKAAQDSALQRRKAATRGYDVKSNGRRR